MRQPIKSVDLRLCLREVRCPDKPFARQSRYRAYHKAGTGRNLKKNAMRLDRLKQLAQPWARNAYQLGKEFVAQRLTLGSTVR